MQLTQAFLNEVILLMHKQEKHSTILDCRFRLYSLFTQTDPLQIKQVGFPFCSTT